MVPILWQHKSDEVIGEGVIKEHQGKILIDGKLDLEDETGLKAYRKLKRRLVKGLSIGFQTVKSTYEEVEGRMVRHIGELKLWEVSVVTFPMLPDAQVTRVKSDDRVSALESQVQALHARLTAMSTTPDEGAGKSGDGAASQTTEPGEAHSTVTLNIPASLLA
jgi:HK97 family phage prohead protease